MKNIIYLILLFVLAVSTVSAALSDTSIISMSLVNQDPDPAIAGEVVEVRLGVENTGGEPANNFIIELVPEYPFELVAGVEAIQDIGTIKGYQYDENMKIVKYKIKVNRDASAGSYELKMRYYEEGSGSKIQKSLSLDVESKESAEVIHIDKTNLIPGHESSLKFTVHNVGNAPLRGMTFSWENEDNVLLPVGSDNTKYIKYLDIGESVELEYKVIPDTNADPGLYKLDLSLTYEDPITGDDEEISTIAGVYVGGETDFDVAFSESSAGETSFSIANIGSNPAYSVSVMIPEQEGWSVSGSNSMIVGNLNKGDYTVASFSLQPRRTTGFSRESMQDLSREEILKMREQTSGEGASNKIKVQIAYTDTMGKRDVVEKEVQISAHNTAATGGEMSQFTGRRMQQQSFLSKYKWYIMGIIVLIVAFILHHKYKKRKLINLHFKLKDLFKKRK